MRMVDIIHKKRDGFELTHEEIQFFIQGYVKENIPDYQVSALMMAIFFKGMSETELSFLVDEMVKSGDVIDLTAIQGIKVDKHSTGGVGDKTSLIVGPLVASVGVPVAKMSGRGLGHTGGTIDKLESIDGFKTELSETEFIKQVNDVKIAISGQTGHLVPADKMLYALRDVTATVESIPLIASSIMSKKLASGADAIVLDVKVGTGAFMKTMDEAKRLAEAMVTIGESLNRKTVAVISSMNQPLGHEIGNANEVREAIQTLKGEGPEDLQELCLTIASHMVVLGGIFDQVDVAYQSLLSKLKDGSAYDRFKTFIKRQGGNLKSLEAKQAKYHIDVHVKQKGYLHRVDSEGIGIAAMLLGAGRKEKGDPIDHSVGITMHKKLGDELNQDDVIFTIHANRDHVSEVIDRLNKSYDVQENPFEKEGIVYSVIRK
ncbi:pyrimidine-nucleoside phosphorylase [Terrilactibacillus laevilacticus]|uniref:pyrimidine-nucleoside phosphorylase n=1 Tax=Terrilactibacillus laevilacticus TaxID=1380157 RepID=UPI001146757D|nr:pyrimidine-nucleoside phosphorylase [Terrilactibacillus laevilacticus]